MDTKEGEKDLDRMERWKDGQQVRVIKDRNGHVWTDNRRVMGRIL